jgi:hypothetical protein
MKSKITWSEPCAECLALRKALVEAYAFLREPSIRVVACRKKNQVLGGAKHYQEVFSKAKSAMRDSPGWYKLGNEVPKSVRKTYPPAETTKQYLEWQNRAFAVNPKSELMRLYWRIKKAKVHVPFTFNFQNQQAYDGFLKVAGKRF